MPIVKTSKTDIMQKAITLFREHGYHHSSMQDLAKSCGLLKGSFYHYFPSKDALLSEILIYLRAYLKKHVFSIAEERDISPEKRMEKLLLKLGRMLLTQNGGCFVGNITLEIAGKGLGLEAQLKGIFDDWIEAMTSIYASKMDIVKAQRAAVQSVMEFEGAVMLNRLYQNDQILKDCFVRAMVKLG